MGTRGIFVGVDQHLHVDIPELNGARRDATALWALFSDTIDGFTARLLVNEDATQAEVSKAIIGGLATAEDHDVIVISFAGHGSRDGGLVLFNTDPADLSGTTLPMAALADAFKATKARAVLCILDCCSVGRPQHECWKPRRPRARHSPSPESTERDEFYSPPAVPVSRRGNNQAPATGCSHTLRSRR